MFRIIIAARNIIIGVLLSWIGMSFTPADSDQDRPAENPEATSFLGLR